ncbi:MAG: hypothetical protein PVF70_09625 [Anaerolineales bacterium]|jgi:hypothetical protein
MRVNGILLLYHHRYKPNAPTIGTHVKSFERYSRFKVWPVNTAHGFPPFLKRFQFQIILLHYSVFASRKYRIGQAFLRYLEGSDSSYKIAFFQDEHQFCQQRFAFINRYGLDCVYTLVEPAQFAATYEEYTQVPRLVSNIPGYVDDELIDLARELHKPDHERTIDVSYRGRRLAFYMGKGSQEKFEIGEQFRSRAADLGLRLDIEVDISKRIYGRGWFEFLADSRAGLGVESGVSVFDVDDQVYPQYEKLMAENPKISFEEMSERVLLPYEDNIYYRTISPRHFEMAAFRVTQILYEGDYSGILKPMVHYIPLKKDFSNFDDVIRMFKDQELRKELTENAYRDLIASRHYSYRRFMQGFDQGLLEEGLRPEISAREVARVSRWFSTIKLLEWVSSLRRIKFPGRAQLVGLIKRMGRRA